MVIHCQIHHVSTLHMQIVPYFIVDVFSDLPGVPGLLLTGLFGAALRSATVDYTLDITITNTGVRFIMTISKTCLQ